MKIAFFAYVDAEEGPPGYYAGCCRFRPDGNYGDVHPGCVVIDVADFRKWNDAKRHANTLAGFDINEGVFADDEFLVFNELTGDAVPCFDHWHCDPALAAHMCNKYIDRKQPCPTCGDRP